MGERGSAQPRVQDHAGRVDHRREPVPVERGEPDGPRQEDLVLGRCDPAGGVTARVTQDALDRVLHEGAAELLAPPARGIGSQQRVDRGNASELAACGGARHAVRVLPRRARSQVSS